MSEVYIPLPPEVAELLQEGCRDCLFARNLLREALSNGLNTVSEAERINLECITWQGEQTPQEDLIKCQ